MVTNHNWLVVWNMNFIFSIYWELHNPIWLSYFSEGLKPPTIIIRFQDAFRISFRHSPSTSDGQDQLCGLDYDVCANLMGGQNCEASDLGWNLPSWRWEIDRDIDVYIDVWMYRCINDFRKSNIYIYIYTVHISYIYIYDEQATVRAMQRPNLFSTCKRTPSADCTWPKGPLIHTASATHMFIVGPHCNTSAATSKLTRPPCEGPFQLCIFLYQSHQSL